MKTLAACVLTFLLTILLFNSNLTGWRLVRQADLAVKEQQIEVLAQQSAQENNKAVNWRLDPNYRTPLEKKSPAAEAARRR